ncbi:MAG: hypothetical protein ACR2QB_05130 [Gammaproteobacteria bacterium]
MKRTFLFSFLAGIVLTVALAALFPLPRHERFVSHIEALNNGGRGEEFQIRWPQDRLNLDSESTRLQLGDTAGLVVMAGDVAGPAAVELFRLRDVQGSVIGLASRLTAPMPGRRGGMQSVSNWTLAIPSRGSLLLSQENGADMGPVRRGGGWVAAADAPDFWATGNRYRISAGPAPGGRGRVLKGSGEFAGLSGDYSEVWELKNSGADERSEGLIKLSTLTTRGP